MSDDKTTPAHYRPGDPYEAIKIYFAAFPSAKLGPHARITFRAGRKPGESALDDLRKASWYIDNEIRALSPKPALSEQLAVAIRSAPVVISAEDPLEEGAIAGLSRFTLAARARGYDPSALTIEQTCELLNFLEPGFHYTPHAEGGIVADARKKAGDGELLDRLEALERAELEGQLKMQGEELAKLRAEVARHENDARLLKINLGRVIDSCEVDGPDLISRAERAAEELAELRRIKSVAQITMAALARSGFEEGGLGERVGKLLRLYTRACAELQDLKGE